MANISNKAKILTAKVIEVHDQWCRDNGYPVNKTKPQAGRPKRQASSNEKSNKQ